jgi:hypothetical protein
MHHTGSTGTEAAAVQTIIDGTMVHFGEMIHNKQSCFEQELVEHHFHRKRIARRCATGIAINKDNL